MRQRQGRAAGATSGATSGVSAGMWGGALDDALAQDTQLVFQQMGLQTLRISLLKRGSLDAQSSCLIGEQGDVQQADTSRHVDSVFPGGAAHLEDLMNRPELFTSVRKLSPRHWLLAWRLQDGHAVVADAKFHDKRDALSDADAAIIRLVCNTSFGRLQDEAADADTALAAAQVWPQVERRQRSTSSRPAWPSLLLLATAVLCSAWLLFMALPNEQRRADALQAEFNQLRDGTLNRSLSAALATGDYGEVQLALQNFLDLGQFQSAVVTNDKQRLIAMAGSLPNQRIGEAVAPAYANAAKVLKLATGSQQHGELLYEPKLASHSGNSASVWVAALALLAGLALLAWQLMGRQAR
jgi:hypothetical protein